VKTDAKWDHKQKIRAKFKQYAVPRPLRADDLPDEWVQSESYFHNYKDYDYYFDVWSNIHYGYVGLSVGFDETTLRAGSHLAQLLTQGTEGFDTKDDATAINIGFALYKEFGKDAACLTPEAVLTAVDRVPAESDMPESKQIHWCWHPKNPNPTKHSKSQR
jgi:hypothetical protein